MDLQLTQKRALVTGSTGGIGFSIAKGLAAEGARVIVTGRGDAEVQKARDEIQKATGVEVDGFAGDLARADVNETLVRAFPEVDIVINNLGIFEPKPFEEIPDEDWRRLFEINVLTGVRFARSYLPRMRAKNWGRIIFISSESAIQIPVEMIHYGMTKAAQIAIARGIAETTVGTGITVNSVLPGPTRSQGVSAFLDSLAQQAGKSTAEFDKEFFERARPSSLLKRFATPEETASLVVYLSSPLSSATNGAALRVDGGVIRSAY